MPNRFLDLTIAELLNRCPAAAAVLKANGLARFTEQEVLATFGGLLKLRTILKAQQLNPELFCRLLEEETAAPAPSADTASPPNLFALLPCPLKVPLEEAFHRFVDALPAERRAGLSWLIEGNANQQLDYADYADHFERLDEMPDIIITPGFNSFFHPPFVERFIKPGRFQSLSDPRGDRHLAPLGLADPDGHYTMLATNLLLPVVDRERLGDRPLPRRWADLLDPVYTDSIAIRGNRDGTFCETLLLTFFQEFGSPGLEQLGRNVRYGWHPSQMVKAMSTSQPDSPAISVMPLFFARNIRNLERVELVWPEDGALVSPVTMLVKAEKREALADLVAFLGGPEVARICADAFFPTLHPAVDNRIPDGASFKWIGWDYVKENDLRELIAATNQAFLQAFQGQAS